MPTDEEIRKVLENHAVRHDNGCVAAIRALFAQPEPERMSVRLQLAGQIYAAWCHSDMATSEKDAGYALQLADALIAQDAQGLAKRSGK